MQLLTQGGKAVENPYQPPQAFVADMPLRLENNSGQGRGVTLPPGVAGWSWGAFLLNWIWALANSTWIGLLAIIPYVGFIVAIYLGVKGRELAWCNKRWASVEEFDRVQKSWSKWGVILVFGMIGLGILAALVIPMLQGGQGGGGF
jgi:hypothetical protein